MKSKKEVVDGILGMLTVKYPSAMAGKITSALVKTHLTQLSYPKLLNTYKDILLKEEVKDDERENSSIPGIC